MSETEFGSIEPSTIDFNSFATIDSVQQQDTGSLDSTMDEHTVPSDDLYEYLGVVDKDILSPVEEADIIQTIADGMLEIGMKNLEAVGKQFFHDLNTAQQSTYMTIINGLLGSVVPKEVMQIANLILGLTGSVDIANVFDDVIGEAVKNTKLYDERSSEEFTSISSSLLEISQSAHGNDITRSHNMWATVAKYIGMQSSSMCTIDSPHLRTTSHIQVNSSDYLFNLTSKLQEIAKVAVKEADESYHVRSRVIDTRAQNVYSNKAAHAQFITGEMKFSCDRLRLQCGQPGGEVIKYPMEYVEQAYRFIISSMEDIMSYGLNDNYTLADRDVIIEGDMIYLNCDLAEQARFLSRPTYLSELLEPVASPEVNSKVEGVTTPSIENATPFPTYFTANHATPSSNQEFGNFAITQPFTQ